MHGLRKRRSGAEQPEVQAPAPAPAPTTSKSGAAATVSVFVPEVSAPAEATLDAVVDKERKQQVKRHTKNKVETGRCCHNCGGEYASTWLYKDGMRGENDPIFCNLTYECREAAGQTDKARKARKAMQQGGKCAEVRETYERPNLRLESAEAILAFRLASPDDFNGINDVKLRTELPNDMVKQEFWVRGVYRDEEDDADPGFPTTLWVSRAELNEMPNMKELMDGFKAWLR